MSSVFKRNGLNECRVVCERSQEVQLSCLLVEAELFHSFFGVPIVVDDKQVDQV